MPLERSPHVVCYPTGHQLQHKDSLCAPREAALAKAPSVCWNYWKGNISFYCIFLSLFFPQNGSKVNKVDFSNPATWSWIRASSKSFCACHAHTCSVVLQMVVIYSAMNLNEGNAVKPSCSRCLDGISRSICQLIKSTYSFQLCGFIPIIISLSLLKLEIKAFGPRSILYPPKHSFTSIP